MANSKPPSSPPAQPAKPSTPGSPAAPRGAPKPAAAAPGPAAAAAAELRAACPLAPPGHFALLDEDNQVGDHVLCEVNHSLRVASLHPLKVVPA
ncbi:MAG TPA: hypothetical protein VFT22_11760 [Kofleriaceae bacterium]|nr:hypothetical protein [Kofleriaceae bacterium]